MRGHYVVIRLGLFLIAALGFAGCGGDEDAVPATVDSGFNFATDAFLFENSRENTINLTPDLAARMFGAKEVCVDAKTPCVATDVAAGWLDSVNRTLAEGSSEGFAVLSLLFFHGDLDPKDFAIPGDDTKIKHVSDLRIDGNAKLQGELAYWAATQSIPTALDEDKRFEAKDVMPFLAKALAKGSDDIYRLAIAKRTESGFSFGHAVTPIGYFKGERDGLYYLRVYDNNNARREAHIAIDEKANTWTYEVAVDDETTLLYEGNAENQNVLYFSPINKRLGEHIAPFAMDSGTSSVISEGSIQALATAGEASAGIKDGKVVEMGGSVLMPAFSNCTKCASLGVLNYFLKDQSSDINIAISGMSKTNTDGSQVNVSGPGYTTSVSGITGAATDKNKLSVSPSGGVSFTSEMGTPVKVTSAITVGKKQVTITVTVDGAATSLEVGVDSMGRPTVDTSGLPAGATVVMAIATVDEKGNTDSKSATVTSTGDDTQIKVDLDTGKIATMSGDTTGTCFNAMADPDFEVGLDCGDTCEARCAEQQPCLVTSDCVQGLACRTTTTKPGLFCLGAGCDDSVKNVEETDVDCGGPSCKACVANNSYDAPIKCALASDCDTGICLDGKCKAKNMVSLAYFGDVGVTVPVNYTLDGVEGTKTIKTTKAKENIELGKAYVYSTSLGAVPAGTTCTLGSSVAGVLALASGITGNNGDSGGVVTRTPYLLCGGPLSHYVTVKALPSGQTVWLNKQVDDKVPALASVNQTGFIELGTFLNTWALSVATQPGLRTTTTGVEYTECAFAGAASGTRSNIYSNLLCAPAPKALSLTTTGILSGGTVYVSAKLDDGTPGTKSVATNTTTSIGNYHRDWNLSVTQQPGLIYVGPGVRDRSWNTCKFGGQDTATGDRTNTAPTLACSATACPGAGCPKFLTITTTGLPAGGQVTLSRSFDNDNAQNYIMTGSGDAYMGTYNSKWEMFVVIQPKIGSTNYYCSLNSSNDPLHQVGTSVQTATVTCEVAGGGGTTCTTDAECGTSNCECGVKSGNCTSNSGKCGVLRTVFDSPTTDGTTASGTFTVPASCDEVSIQAWGAAGGPGASVMMFPFPMSMILPGGAGSYVHGKMSVAQGDVINVWVGQGGNVFGQLSPYGTSGIGSYVGTRADGGSGSTASPSENGGGGGGLTSIQQTGSVTRSFVVPAGGGGSVINAGGDASSFGGGAAGSAGEDGLAGSAAGGGGAGEEGGSGGQSYGAGGGGGTYSTLPAGFTSGDGAAGEPLGKTTTDYGLCVGMNGGSPSAGQSKSFMSGQSGDGCVVIRCVGK